MRKLIYKIAVKIIINRLIRSDNKLTPEYLISKGWIAEYNQPLNTTFYVESNVKDRDKVLVCFENHYYRVYHSNYITFIALESTIEWLQIHLLLLDKHGKGI